MVAGDIFHLTVVKHLVNNANVTFVLMLLCLESLRYLATQDGTEEVLLAKHPSVKELTLEI